MSSTTIELGDPLERSVPALGLGLPVELTPPGESQRALLAALRLDHVRADLHQHTDGWQDRLEAATAYANALETRLELALHLPADPSASNGNALAPLAAAPLARVLVLADGCATTPGALVVAVRARLRGLGITCPVGGGTDMFFADLNMERPDLGAMEFVGYPITPQVHAFDDASVMETPAIQGLSVETVRSWNGGCPIAVTPISLRMRYNPWAAGADSIAQALPSNVDHRQASLLCAAWAVASVASLAYSGADAVTYFETVGRRGVLEEESGAARDQNELFGSEPGMTFPVYHALRAVADCRTGRLVDVSKTADDRVCCLAVRTTHGLRTLLANLTPSDQVVQLRRLPVGEAAVRTLDVSTVRALMHAAAELLPLPAKRAAPRGVLEVALPPYAIAVVETR